MPLKTYRRRLNKNPRLTLAVLADLKTEQETVTTQELAARLLAIELGYYPSPL
jgi:hypothetical protein